MKFLWNVWLKRQMQAAPVCSQRLIKWRVASMPGGAVRWVDRMRDLDARVRQLEEFALPHQTLVKELDAHIKKSYDALEQARAVTEQHFLKREKATASFTTEVEAIQDRIHTS